MRKRILIFLTAALLLLLLFGCGKAASQQPPAAVKFTGEFTAAYGDMALGGTLERAAAGMLTVVFDSPETLKGLTVCSDGKQTTVALGVLHYTLDTSLPETAAAQLLLNTLDDLFCKAGAGELTGDTAVYSGKAGQYAYRLRYAPDTGMPVSLEVPDARFTVQFGNMKTTE